MTLTSLARFILLKRDDLLALRPKRSVRRCVHLSSRCNLACEVAQLCREALDLALAGEDAHIARIGAMKAHGIPAELMSLCVDRQRSGGERKARHQRRDAFDRVAPREPFLHERARRLIGISHERSERA